MSSLTYIFISFLLYPTAFSYWTSEENLLHILKNNLKERETLLHQSTRHLASIIKAYNITSKTYTCYKHTRDISSSFWTSTQHLTRIVVYWENLLQFLYTWPSLAKQVRDHLMAHFRGVMGDFIVEDNDYKLINYVKRIMKSKMISENKYTPLRRLHSQLVINTVQKLKKSLKNFIQITSFVQPKDFMDRSHYSKLCQGKIESNNSQSAKCRYLHNNNPYLLIGPFKVEELLSDPPVCFYHDVLTDSEIETIKERSLKQEMHISQGTETMYRVAKVAWLTKNVSESALRRTGLMTNLNMNASESLHVALYGVAGHCGPHYDADINYLDGTSNRMSTVLFYLNDNLQGGATIFPMLNLTIFPKKGGALVWYNLRSNYEVDPRTVHASCPLYAGAKWVGNLWIGVEGQELRVLCDAKRKDTFMIEKYPKTMSYEKAFNK